MTSAREEKLSQSKERKSDDLDMNDPKLRILKIYHDLQPKESVRKIILDFMQLKLNKQKIIEKFIDEAKESESERSLYKTSHTITLDEGSLLCIPSNIVDSDKLEVLLSNMFYVIEFPYLLVQELFKEEDKRRTELVNLTNCLDNGYYCSLDAFIRALGLSCLPLLIEHQRWVDFKFHNHVMHEINPVKHTCYRQVYNQTIFEAVFVDLIKAIPDDCGDHKESSNKPLECLQSLCTNYQYFDELALINILAIADQFKKHAALEVLVNRFTINACLGFAFADDKFIGRITNFSKERILQLVNTKFKTSLVQLFDDGKYDEVNQFLKSCGEIYLKRDQTRELFIEALRGSKRKFNIIPPLLEADFGYICGYLSRVKLESQNTELPSARMFSAATSSPEFKETKQIISRSAAQVRKA